MNARSSGSRAVRGRLKAILFDHDGTLVDSEPAHFQMWCEILGAHGVSLSGEEYKRRYAGMPAIANARNFIQSAELAVSPESLVKTKNEATQAYLVRQGFPLMPGVRESIRIFQRSRLQLAVVTAAARVAVLASIHAHAMRDLFSEVVSLDDVDRGKPAPDGYLFALDRLQLSADECIAIEDTEHGVAAAADAGIICLAVPTAMSKDHDFSRAAGTFSCLEDATSWITTRFELCSHGG